MIVSSISVVVAAEACGLGPSSDGIPLPLSITTPGESNACAESQLLDGGPDSKRSAPTSAPTGMPASMVAWMESQRASLAEILARQAAALDSMAQARAQRIAESLRQSTIFDLPGCSWKIAPSSELEAAQESPPTSWRATCAGETESLPRLIVAPLTSESDGSALLPTLTICGNYNRVGASPTSGDGLVTALRRHLPTLLASDSTSGAQSVARRPSGSKGMTNLRGALRIGTLTRACSHTDRSPAFALNRIPTPRELAGGPLNPMWTEWFMGWPMGSSALLPLEMPGFQSKRQRRSKSLPDQENK